MTGGRPSGRASVREDHAPREPGGPGLRGRQAAAGWLFVAPVLVILGLFLAIPVVMALWVSFSNWNGQGSPFGGSVEFVGLDNYRALLAEPGLARSDLAVALRNNVYFVALVVPIQTALALFLAVLVNRRILAGRGFFRTAFYFPSVTSSVAITVLFLFLFNTFGAVNAVLGWLGVNGPNWLADPRGVLHLVLSGVGVDATPAWLADHAFLGLSWWDWLAGPSVAMCVFIILAIFTTSGTFMLLFLAALQNVGADVEEAAIIDGAGSWSRFRRVTLPMIRPMVFTVLTLGLIATWQVFDMIYTGSQGAPGKTTLTPAFLSYSTSFVSQRWGQGAAISFVLFAIIVVLTAFQRWVLRDRPLSRRRRFQPPEAAGATTAKVAP